MELHRGYIELILETNPIKYLLKIGQISSLFQTFSSWKFLVPKRSTATIHLRTLLSIPALLTLFSLWDLFWFPSFLVN